MTYIHLPERRLVNVKNAKLRPTRKDIEEEDRNITKFFKNFSLSQEKEEIV